MTPGDPASKSILTHHTMPIKAARWEDSTSAMLARAITELHGKSSMSHNAELELRHMANNSALRETDEERPLHLPGIDEHRFFSISKKQQKRQNNKVVDLS